MLYAGAMAWLIRIAVYGALGLGGVWLLGALGIPHEAFWAALGVVGFFYLESKLDNLRYRIAKLELDRHDDSKR